MPRIFIGFSEIEPVKLRGFGFKKYMRKCKQCGKIIKKYTNIFCNRECFNNWKFDKNHIERHPRWKGGIYIGKDGYVYLRSKEHPNANRDYYVLRSRLTVEKQIKRYLTHLEIIHHINEIKNDDRIENLYLFASKSAHTTYHLLLKNKRTKLITKSNLL